MSSFNKVILLGNLTRDPEVRYAPNGTAVASFSLAVNSRVKQPDGYKDKVDYIDIIAFGKTAENCGQYVFRGSMVLIEGRLNQRRWDDKNTGQKRSKIEVAAQQVTFISRPANTSAAAGVQGVPRGGRESTKPDENRRGATGGIPPNVAGAFPDAVPVDEGEIPF